MKNKLAMSIGSLLFFSTVAHATPVTMSNPGFDACVTQVKQVNQDLCQCLGTYSDTNPANQVTACRAIHFDWVSVRKCVQIQKKELLKDIANPDAESVIDSMN